MKQLANGCFRSEVSVYPSDWEKAGASIKKPWQVWYRFYDPKHPDDWGKQIPVKKGINSFKTLAERRAAVRILVEEVTRSLDEMDYNPLTGYIKRIDPKPIDSYIISPRTHLNDALDKAFVRFQGATETRRDMKSVLSYFKRAAENMMAADIPITEIRAAHILGIFDELGRIKKGTWTNNNYNHYRAYISMLFKILVDNETIGGNPVTKVPVKETVQKIRTVLTTRQRVIVDSSLRKNNYRFWLLMNIFFHSGSRGKEIVLVQAKNVSIINQKFKATVNKGQSREVEHTIKDVALPFWIEAVKGANPEDFIFSKGLKPGPVPISAKQISRRWKRWVKDKLGIEADFYPLKHLNSTETASLVGTKVAAKHNFHSEQVLTKHYDVTNDQRTHQILKKVNNPFVPVCKDEEKAP